MQSMLAKEDREFMLAGNISAGNYANCIVL
jgi:hypothetical protein